MPVDVDTFFLFFPCFFLVSVSRSLRLIKIYQTVLQTDEIDQIWLICAEKTQKKPKKKFDGKSTYKSVFRRINWFSDEILRKSTRLLDGFFLKKIICHPNIQKPKIGLTKSWFPIVQVAQTTTNAKTHPLV